MTSRKVLFPPARRFRVQWVPNLIVPERRLVLTRLYWNRGTSGDGRGYSCKLSLSLCWAWHEVQDAIKAILRGESS